MSTSRRRYSLTKIEVNYLKSSLENGSLTKKKQILQYICRIYRQGGVINPRDQGLELLIIGLISADKSNEKIRKWALTALQYVGSKDQSTGVILYAIKNFQNEPDVQAAAISTMFHYDPENANNNILTIGACSPNIIKLAALQSNNQLKNSPQILINIEKAEIIELKLALILVGLDRAPNNLFDPKYSNAKIIKELGGHHNSIVSQYTLWAAAENKNLGINDIGIDLKSIESQPPNVRSYLYRLIAESNNRCNIYHEIIEHGTQDPDEEARNGLALSLRDNYYDGLENIMIDWYYDEEIPEIRYCVLDHIIAQSGACIAYVDDAISAYNENFHDVFKKMRMDAAAEKTPLYREFKKISYQQDNLDLFTQGDSVVNNTFNFDRSNIGNLSTAENSQNTGTVHSVYNENKISEIKGHLNDINNYISNSNINKEEKKKIISAIDDAYQNPTRDKLKALNDRLEAVKKTLSVTESAISIATKIGGYILLISSLL